MIPTVVLTIFLVNYVRAAMVFTAVTSALADQNLVVRAVKYQAISPRWFQILAQHKPQFLDDVEEALLQDVKDGRSYRLAWSQGDRAGGTARLDLVPQDGGPLWEPLRRAVERGLINLRAGADVSFNQLRYFGEFRTIDIVERLDSWVPEFIRRGW